MVLDLEAVSETRAPMAAHRASGSVRSAVAGRYHDVDDRRADVGDDREAVADTPAFQ